MRVSSLFLAALVGLLLPGVAVATTAGCGTVVLPSGLGLSAPGAVTSLNPLLTTSVYNLEVSNQIYRPLIWLDRHLEFDPTRSIASAVATPDGGHSWRFTLHAWQWSDGVPVTPDDVAFTFGLIRKIGPGYVKYGIGGIPDYIQDVRATGPHEVTLTLNHAANPDWFLRLGLGGLPVLPSHVYRGLSLRDMRMRQTDPSLFRVSDGPFLVDEFAVGRYLALVPNPLYGGTPPKLRRLVIDFLEGGSPLQALRAGEIDAADIPYNLWDLATALPNLRTIRLGGGFSYDAMILNFHSSGAPFLRDVRVRQAMTLAIDENEIISLVFHGQSTPIHGPVPPAMAKLLSPLAMSGYPRMQFSPQRARALLDEAGWHPGPDGIRSRDGHRLQFEVEATSGIPTLLTYLQIVQRNFAAVGIAMDIRAIDFNEMISTLQGNGHDWDAAVLGWTVEGFPDSQEFFSSNGAQNYGHYEDKTMDALNAAVVQAAGHQALDAAQDYAAEQQPFLFLPAGEVSVLARPELHGIAKMTSPNGNWSPELLTLSGNMACPSQVAATR